ncbi:hypothetical protein BS78_07G170800 [Paspalum vaginatum]|nr:hypothetical protein BS78_07G170800 [Paspalum vaginatum]KAJ1268924.1 hypothetical protein BS78_07G170800 [Paspalum vaginatum]
MSVAELLCLGPPAICSVVCVALVLFAPGSATGGPPLAGGRLLVVQYALLVGAVAIGSLIRRRQVGRLHPSGGAADEVGVGLLARLEKVEESVRGMVATVGVLSRTVEKLGLRFRVFRRTLRDPISETGDLAQKNSEATHILAAQEALLEKEIGAIQKVLYAMQEQQQKQLDLILAIGEASRALDAEQDLLNGDSSRSSNGDSSRSSSASPVPEIEKESKQAETKSETVAGGNNKP